MRIIATLILLVVSALASSKPPQAPEADLGWSLPTSGCGTGSPCTYNVYRGPSSGTETLLVSGIVPLNYADTTVVRGSFYCYEVTAVNAAGEGAKSNEVCGTDPTVPSAPGNLTVTFK